MSGFTREQIPAFCECMNNYFLNDSDYSKSKISLLFCSYFVVVEALNDAITEFINQQLTIYVGTDVLNVEPREEQVLVSVNTEPFSPYNTISQSRSPSPPIITTRNLTPALRERWEYEDAQRWDSEDSLAFEIHDSDSDSDTDAIEIHDSDSDSDSNETFFEENVSNQEQTLNQNVLENVEEEKLPGRINCPLCMMQDIATPMALLCGHITCNDCFEKWKKVRKENRLPFECPVSRCQVLSRGIKLFHQIE